MGIVSTPSVSTTMLEHKMHAESITIIMTGHMTTRMTCLMTGRMTGFMTGRMTDCMTDIMMTDTKGTGKAILYSKIENMESGALF